MTFNLKYVLTIQHTGTWFILDFLKEYLGDKTTVCQLLYFLARTSAPNGTFGMLFKERINLIHMHFNMAMFSGEQGQQPVRANGDCLYPADYLLYTITKATNNFVIPVRDPLLSLCTRENRRAGVDHKYLIDGFLLLSKYLFNKQNLFPIDLIYTAEEKVLFFKRVLDVLSIEQQDALLPIIEKHAGKWCNRNSRKDVSGLKRAYIAKDFGFMRKIIPNELEYLLYNKKIIIPFLKKLGYKDLGWWVL